jgi:hypothetical protein
LIKDEDIRVKATVASTSGVGAIATTFDDTLAPLPVATAVTLWSNDGPTSNISSGVVSDDVITLTAEIKNLELYPGSSTSAAGKVNYTNGLTFTVAVNPS